MSDAVVFTSGQSQTFVANRDFALNWEDKKLLSVKVRAGESLSYDGSVASYTNARGVETTGRCPSLKSAINVMGWLSLKSNGKVKKSTVSKINADAPAPQNKGDFDKFRGGSFDTFASKNNDGVYVAPRLPIVRESEMIVRNITSPNMGHEPTVNTKEGKLEVSGDQIEVKKGFTVNSSTSARKEARMSTKIIRADEGGAEGTIAMKDINAQTTGSSKKNKVTLDGKTPLTIGEDMTMAEVQKMKVTSSDESQDAKVVGKINQKMEVQTVDGITFRKQSAAKSTDSKTVEGITLKKVASPKELKIDIEVKSGGEMPVTAESAGTVVGTLKSIAQKDADAAEKAKARAASRKAAASSTQALMEKDKKVAPKSSSESPDYLLMLPETWGKMHWSQRVAFIKELTDKAFIEFIMSVETAKAIQEACIERLKNLG
jgi:hypothetical protein